VEFYHFIFEQGLMDIPLVGDNFMRSNNQDTPSWFRIGRFLFSLDWDAQFPYASQRRLSKCFIEPLYYFA
jgi:hypothetical protein